MDTGWGSERLIYELSSLQSCDAVNQPIFLSKIGMLASALTLGQAIMIPNSHIVLSLVCPHLSVIKMLGYA